jgi:hypothetical protein
MIHKGKITCVLKTKCAVNVTYFSTSITLLSKELLNIFICESFVGAAQEGL